MSLIIYGTTGCKLCADAEALVHNPVILGMLKRKGVGIVHRDISEDVREFEMLASRIPVVAIEGRTDTLDWPFSLLDLKSYLERTLLLKT